MSHTDPNPISNLSRSHLRTVVKRDAKLKAIDLFNDRAESLPVSIVDVSLSGAKLISRQSIPIGSLWHLSIDETDPERDSIAVIVRRSQQHTDHIQWVAGVEILWPANTLLPLGIGYSHLLKADPHITSQQVEQKEEHTFASATGRFRTDGDLKLDELIGNHAAIGGTFTVSGMVENCQLSVGKSIQSNGHIVGGTIRCGESIAAKRVGQSGIPTRLCLNVSVRVDLLTETVRYNQSQMTALDNELAELKLAGDSASHKQRERSTLLTYEMSVLQSQLNRFEADLKSEQEKVSQISSYSFDVSEELDSDVELQIGMKKFSINAPIEGPFTIEAGADGLIRLCRDQSTVDLATETGVNVIKRAA